MRSMRYGRSLTSSRKSTHPAGGSNAYGVPSDAASCVSVPPYSGPLASPSRRTTNVSGLHDESRDVPSNQPGERRFIVAVGSPRQPALDHRPVERRDPALTGQPRQERGVVAVRNEQLRRGLRPPSVKLREQVHASVPAANRHQSGDRAIGPGVDEGGGAALRGARGEHRPVEYGIVVYGLIPKPAQLLGSLLELFA